MFKVQDLTFRITFLSLTLFIIESFRSYIWMNPLHPEFASSTRSHEQTGSSFSDNRPFALISWPTAMLQSLHPPEAGSCFLYSKLKNQRFKPLNPELMNIWTVNGYQMFKVGQFLLCRWSTILNVLPMPSRDSLRNSLPPWYCSTILLARLRPSPQPLFLLLKPGLKIFFFCWGEIPLPLSSISI